MWKPFDTAPTDSTLFLAATIVDGNYVQEPHAVKYVTYHPDTNLGRFVATNGNIYDHESKCPTHWMPLPTPYGVTVYDETYQRIKKLEDFIEQVFFDYPGHMLVIGAVNLLQNSITQRSDRYKEMVEKHNLNR